MKADLTQREKQRGSLVRMCREGGLPAVDAQTGKVLRALSKAGIFRLRGVIVGTHAFRCYPGLLGVEIPEAHAVTEDIDVAAFHSVSIALDDRMDPTLAETLKRIGPFVARPGLHRQPTAWRDRGERRPRRAAHRPTRDRIATNRWNCRRWAPTPFRSGFSIT